MAGPSSIRRGARAAAVALFAATASLPAGAETLGDALIAAYKHSNLLDQNRALLRAADEDVVQAAAALLPVIEFVTSANFVSPAATGADNWTATAAIQGQITLYDNGRTRYATDAAKETVLGLRAALLQVEQAVLLEAVQAYMEMIRAAQAVSLGQSNVRLITQELRAARDRFEVGEVTRTDVAIAEARLAAARGNLVAAQGDLEIAREAYRAAIGRDPGNLRWPSAPPGLPRAEPQAKAIAVRNHPSIEEAQRNINAADANVARAEAALGPRVSANTALTARSATSNTTFSAGVSLNVPVYQGGTLRSLIRQAMARRDASRSGLLQAVVEVKQNVGIAWANVAVAAARTEAARRQVRASQIAFEGLREEAKLGARTTLDVLNAEQDLLDARTALITSEVQQYVSVYALLAAMGLLTVEHLNLGIVTYDPAAYYRYATTRDPLNAASVRGRRLDSVLRRLGKD